MTEIRTPSTDRWIPFLGLALVIEAAMNAASPVWTQMTAIQAAKFPYLSVLLTAIVPGVVGAHMMAGHRRDSFPGVSIRLAYAAIVGLNVSYVVQLISNWTPSSLLLSLQPVALILMGIGMPLLWGSALARLLHPGDASLQKFGRIGGGLIQLGFVFEFFVRLQNWDLMQSMTSGSGSAASAVYALSSLLDIAGSVALLWATVEAMRTAPDEDAILRRAHRTHRLMSWYMVLMPLQTVIFQAAMQMRYSLGAPAWPDLAFTLAGVLLHATLLTATSFVLARWLRLQFAASSSPIPRSGGVE